MNIMLDMHKVVDAKHRNSMAALIVNPSFVHEGVEDQGGEIVCLR